MNCSGDYFLPGSSLAQQQYRRVGWGDSSEVFHHALLAGARPDHFFGSDLAIDLLLEVELFLGQAFFRLA